MSKIVYFLRKSNMDKIEKSLHIYFKMTPCIKSKKEMVFENNDLLISCKKKYISVIYYDEIGEKKLNKLVEIFEK